MLIDAYDLLKVKGCLRIKIFGVYLTPTLAPIMDTSRRRVCTNYLMVCRVWVGRSALVYD